jgi:hypothetical protein
MELLELPKVMPMVVRSLGSGPALAPLSLIVLVVLDTDVGVSEMVGGRCGRLYLLGKARQLLGLVWQSTVKLLVGVSKISRKFLGLHHPCRLG